MDRGQKRSTDSGSSFQKQAFPLHRSVHTNETHRTLRFRVVRASIGIKLGHGLWVFRCGDQLDGALTAHPVNAFRKVIIATESGTFNINEEDIEEV